MGTIRRCAAITELIYHFHAAFCRVLLFINFGNCRCKQFDTQSSAVILNVVPCEEGAKLDAVRLGLMMTWQSSRAGRSSAPVSVQGRGRPGSLDGIDKLEYLAGVGLAGGLGAIR
jgi:hypothetical protein